MFSVFSYFTIVLFIFSLFVISKPFLRFLKICMRVTDKAHHKNILLYNFDLLKPHFYIVKLSYKLCKNIVFNTSKKHLFGYLLESIEAILTNIQNICSMKK